MGSPQHLRSFSGQLKMCSKSSLMSVVRIDDILVTGRSRGEHLQNLEEVLKRLDGAGVHLKRKQCVFLAPEVVYLGHRINKEGIQPVEVKAIKEAPATTNVKELQAFLGMINYNACYLSNLSTVLAPLHALLSKNHRWKWGKEEEGAYGKRQLKC